MNIELLKRHISEFASKAKKDAAAYDKDMQERADIVKHYKSYTRERLKAMTPDDVYDYLSQLWAMRIWGNKHYVVDKIIDDNGLPNLLQNLSDLLWGDKDVSKRWDAFRKSGDTILISTEVF